MRNLPRLKTVSHSRTNALKTAIRYFFYLLTGPYAPMWWKEIVSRPYLLWWAVKQRYRERRGPVYTEDVMHWLGQSLDHAFRYYRGQIPASKIPSELLAEEG